MQSVPYYSSCMSYMDIFSRSDLVQQKGRYIRIITHNMLIIIVLLCRCGPYMCKYVFLQTIWRVRYLSSNQ